MSTVITDILNSRSEVLENECSGSRILSDECQRSYRDISTDRANKFYDSNMQLECRKDFNHKNCKDYILSDKGSTVASFADKYCGSVNRFLSKDCYLACAGDLRSKLTMCSNRINMFVFLLCVVTAVVIFLLKVSRLVNNATNVKKIV